MNRHKDHASSVLDKVNDCDLQGLEITPSDLFFGLIIESEADNQKVTVKNTTYRSIAITSINITTGAGYFSLVNPNSYPDDLGSGQSFDIEVSFNSEVTGQAIGTLEINTDEDRPPYTVGISGRSVDVPSEADININTVWVPKLAVVNDGERRVVQIADWLFTGADEEPAKPETGYLSPAGLVPLIANGTNIRGATGLGGGEGPTIIDHTRVRLLHDARQGNDDDDNNAFLSLQDDGYTRIYAQAAMGKDDSDGGAYIIGCWPWNTGEAPTTVPLAERIESPGNILSGLNLYGDGKGRTRIKQGNNHNYLLMANAMSPDVANNLNNIRIADLSLEGNLLGIGGQQTIHIVSFFGVDDALFERVHFQAPAGDCLNLGSSPKPGIERHNRRVQMMHCTGDGLTKSNRNIVSVLDCTDFLMAYCEWRRFTTAGNFNPGGIDVEPEADCYEFMRIGRIRAYYNLFQNNNGAAFNLLIGPNPSYTNISRDFEFAFNSVRDQPRMVDLAMAFGDAELKAADYTARNDVRIYGNKGRNISSAAFRAAGTFGVSIVDNEVVDGDAAMVLGSTGTIANRELHFKRNRLIRMGRTNGPVIVQDQETIMCAVEDNDLIGCGRTDKLAGWGLLARAGAIDIRLNKNRVYNDAVAVDGLGTIGRLRVFASNDGGGAISPRSQKVGNEIIGQEMMGPDTFNPTAPIVGLSGSITIGAGGLSIPPNDEDVHDFGIAGAQLGMTFEVTYLPPSNWAAGVRYVTYGYCTEPNIIRTVAENINSAYNWAIPAGTVIRAVQK